MSALTKPIALDETLQRVANALEEISETTGDQKADKVENAVSGNFAGLDGTGNLTDSGCKPSDFLTAEDIAGKLDAPEGTGTVGQSPRIASGGGMEWASVGAPTDAQVETAVSDWLDNHPEATTTVEDGSITKVKLDSSLQQTVDEVGDLKNALNQSNAATNSDIGKAHSPKTVVDGKVTEWQYVEVGGGGGGDLPQDFPTDETAQELLEYETYNAGLTDTALTVIGMLFTNLPQDETATDILHSLELECERLDLIYNGWIAEREGA